MIQVHVARRINGLEEYLILKRSEGEDVYPGIWQVITGTIEANERAQEAALRELFEEAGLRPLEFFCVPFVASFFSTRQNQLQHVPVFAAIVDASAEVVLSEEHAEYRWLSFDEAVTILPFPCHKDGTKFVKDEILNNIQSELFRIQLS